MDKDDIKEVGLEEEDVDFTKNKKGKHFDSDDETSRGIKDTFDDDFIGDDDGFDEEESVYDLGEDEEEAVGWEDVYGFKDEYES